MENRRKFLKRMAGAGLAAAGFGVWAYTVHDPEKPVWHPPEKIYTLKQFALDPDPAAPEMVTVSGSDPAANVRAALDRLGGMGRFIKPGDRVVVKPNMGWASPPEQAATTNPVVVAEAVRQCREAGAGEIIVTDVSINEVSRCFERSGIGEASRRAGASLAYPSESDFVKCDLQGEILKVWQVYREFIEADKLINVPIVKHHSLSKATLAMKNWYGTLGGRRNRLHQQIHVSIADLAQAFKPTLTIMDASRILMRGGPTGGNLSDVKVAGTIIAGTDEVAIDAFSSTLLGYRPDELEFIREAAGRGIGKMDLQKVRSETITV